MPAERMKASGQDKAEPHLVHLPARAVELLSRQLGKHETCVFLVLGLPWARIGEAGVVTML